MPWTTSEPRTNDLHHRNLHPPSLSVAINTILSHWGTAPSDPVPTDSSIDWHISKKSK